jgi:hypothetical protein
MVFLRFCGLFSKRPFEFDIFKVILTTIMKRVSDGIYSMTWVAPPGPLTEDKLWAIRRDPERLKRMPPHAFTMELMLQLAGTTEHALEYMPEQPIEVVKAALVYYGATLRYVTDHTYGLYLWIFENGCVGAFKFMKHELIDETLVKYAIEEASSNLEHVPAKFITREMCDKAVRHNGQLLESVPAQFITQEMCDIAFNDTILAIPYIPREFRRPGWVLRALRKGTESLMRKMKDEDLTEEEMFAVVEQNEFDLRYIKNPTRAVIEKAISGEPRAIEHVKNQTLDLVTMAVEKNKYVFGYVTPEMQAAYLESIGKTFVDVCIIKARHGRDKMYLM